MTSRNFNEKFTPFPSLCHTSLDPLQIWRHKRLTHPAACSVQYRDKFQHILILIYKILTSNILALIAALL